jgi:hypothetical protein
MEDEIIEILKQTYRELKEINLRLTAIEWEIPISILAANEKTIGTIEEVFEDFKINVDNK